MRTMAAWAWLTPVATLALLVVASTIGAGTLVIALCARRSRSGHLRGVASLRLFQDLALSGDTTMKKIIDPLIAVALLGLATSAQAEDGTQGAGPQSCKSWLEARQQGTGKGGQNTGENRT